MEMYKIASKKKYRFTTKKGEISVEQLWSLSLEELNEVAILLDDQVESSSSKKSFINKVSPVNKVNKNKLEIVVDIIKTKMEEDEARQNLANKKANNQKIMELIEQKENENLSKKSITALKAMLKEEEVELEED